MLLRMMHNLPIHETGIRPMFRLEKALHAWGTPRFEEALRQELVRHIGELPLQQGLSLSNYVSDSPATVLINKVSERGNAIQVQVGIIYQGIIGGCSCADDPTPVNENTEYCELLLNIDKAGAATTISLVADDQAE
jgi:hypothetical protein